MPAKASPFPGRLFPRFVGRVAGLPVDPLEGLRAQETLGVYRQLEAIEQELEKLRETIPPALHAAVEGLEDQGLRRALLQLRRDSHNLRRLKPGKVEAVRGYLAADTMADLDRYAELFEGRRTLGEEVRRTFDREHAELRRRFQDLVGDEGFRSGLLISSRTLAGELPRYVRASPERPGSKARQVERSLMRYYSRAALKSTPFSTFCSLVPGSFVGPDDAVGFDGDPGQQSGRIRINKAIYARVLEHLQARPGVRRHFHVELNPTLANDGERWLFLSAIGGREVFHRLAPNGVLELLRDQLSQAPLPLGQLIETLRTHPAIEAEEEEAIGYLDRLLEIGLLRFRIGIREQEVDWDRPLVEILGPIDDEHATAIRAFLTALRSAVDGYADASPDERRKILDATTAEIETLEERLQAKLGLKGKPAFYEDVGGPVEMHLAADDFADVLVEYLALGHRLAWPRTEQASMRYFFDDHYGTEHGPVPLLRFYEDYYREHFKTHLERQRGGGGGAAAARGAEDEHDREADEGDPTESAYDVTNPFDLGLVDAISDANKKLTQRVLELWRADPDGEEIRLEREDLETAVAEVPEPGTACRSASLFAQWVPSLGDDGEDALITNTSLIGYGKYFSRFLHVLPEGLRQDLIANNAQLTARQLAEICGDAAFNANLHPPLLPREISYPTGESGSAEEQIPSPEVAVARDPADPHRLHLVVPATGEQVLPVDLGFLNPRMRPPLYQLLSRFTPPAQFGLPVPSDLTPPDGAEDEGTPDGNGSGEPSEAIEHRPRVTYRGRLILARRQWRIPIERFPIKGRKESDADYFVRVLDWRRALGLPEEVFLRIQPLPPMPKTPAQTEAKGEAPREAAAGTGDPEATATEAPPSDEATTEKNATERTATEKTAGDGSADKPNPAPRLRSHLYKPQYVDFRNPLLVDLFSRATENLDRAMFTFEERLPRSDQLLAHGGQRRVTELVVQVDFPDGTAVSQGVDDD